MATEKKYINSFYGEKLVPVCNEFGTGTRIEITAIYTAFFKKKGGKYGA
jgi:hypothetical protein